MTFVFGRMPRTVSGTATLPLNPEDPVAAYILASKKTPDQRKDELRTATEISTPAPWRTGKGRAR